ncbi:hypothetical protein [Paludisphaera rhizosphaerae]|uniref:hypothetical protein n=1 Tax=Paludisphaera rhizosphaerae TaxID=2711216 RepID=UPI0013ED09A8|nr:hypothetical protein [Paludisphaera rhizosphaerae]
MHRLDLGRLLLAVGRSLGTFALLGLAAAVILGLFLVAKDDEMGATGKENDGDRSVVEVEMADFWASEGFTGLAQAVAAIPNAPRWEDVRALMEARGCTDLRYAILLRWKMKNGFVDDITYVRRPYEDTWRAREFIQILQRRRDPTEFLAQVRSRPVVIGPGDPEEPDTIVQKILDSGRTPR